MKDNKIKEILKLFKSFYCNKSIMSVEDEEDIYSWIELQLKYIYQQGKKDQLMSMGITIPIDDIEIYKQKEGIQIGKRDTEIRKQLLDEISVGVDKIIEETKLPIPNPYGTTVRVEKFNQVFDEARIKLNCLIKSKY